MKGLGRKLIALLVAGALFAAMAVPALAANENGSDPQDNINVEANAAAEAGLGAANDGTANADGHPSGQP